MNKVKLVRNKAESLPNHGHYDIYRNGKWVGYYHYGRWHSENTPLYVVGKAVINDVTYDLESFCYAKDARNFVVGKVERL